MTWFTWPVCVFASVVTLCLFGSAWAVLIAASIGKERARIDEERAQQAANERQELEAAVAGAERTVERMAKTGDEMERQVRDGASA